MAQQQQQHPIFDDIRGGLLEAVQRRVRADAAVLEERRNGNTPLIYAIWKGKSAISLWLIEHRGQHDLDADNDGEMALHMACCEGPLSVVKALVGAGGNLAAWTNGGGTPLIYAALYRHADIVAFLLQQPAVKASIDAVSTNDGTALSAASHEGHQPTVQLLLDAGADPTIPAGPKSPLSLALGKNHHDIAALLHTAITNRLVGRLEEEKRGLEAEKRGLERFVHALAAVIKALVAAQIFHALDSWRVVHLEEGKHGLERALHALAAVVAVLVAERFFFA